MIVPLWGEDEGVFKGGSKTAAGEQELPNDGVGWGGLCVASSFLV